MSNNNIEFQTEYCFPDLKSKESNGLMRYDFFVDNRYLIEFDGEQHYEARARSGFWKDNYNDRHERDLEKNQYALEHNIPLIRIPYWKIKNLKLSDLLPETSKYLIIE